MHITLTIESHQVWWYTGKAFQSKVEATVCIIYIGALVQEGTSTRRQKAEGKKAYYTSFLTFFNWSLISAVLH
ncbi:MAG: hypothetical protein F6K14_18970 [Symploca sp. SIO2C1]|nr:hypothetical protein [Symploca sp. SIO2C1]